MNQKECQDIEQRLISCYNRNTIFDAESESDSDSEINRTNPLTILYKMIHHAQNKTKDLCTSLNDDDDFVICDDIVFTENSNCMCDIEIMLNAKNTYKYNFFTLDKKTDEEIILFQVNRKTKQFSVDNIVFTLSECVHKANSLFFSFNYMNFVD